MRLLSLPALLLLYAHDVCYHYEASLGAPAAAPLRWLRVTSPVCVLAIWALSCAWFRPIHRGMLKVLRGVDPMQGEEQALRANLSIEKKAS